MEKEPLVPALRTTGPNTSSLNASKALRQAAYPRLSSTSPPSGLQKMEAAKTRPVPQAHILRVSRVPQGASAEEPPASTFRFELHIELVTAAR